MVLVHYVERFPSWYSSKKPFPRLRAKAKDSSVGNVPDSSQSWTSFPKLVTQVIIFCSAGDIVTPNIFSKTGAKTGKRCFASPPLQSRSAQLFQGFLGSVNIDNLRFVNLQVVSCIWYMTCIWSKMHANLSHDATFPGPSYQHA